MIPALMVVLIIHKEDSDCVPLEQMWSSGCSAANRPLGNVTTTHLTSISPPDSTVFVAPLVFVFAED